jgi:hypothetical protein
VIAWFCPAGSPLPPSYATLPIFVYMVILNYLVGNHIIVFTQFEPMRQYLAIHLQNVYCTPETYTLQNVYEQNEYSQNVLYTAYKRILYKRILTAAARAASFWYSRSRNVMRLRLRLRRLRFQT